MNALTFAVGVVALAALIGVLLLAQRVRRAEERLRAHERHLAPAMKRAAARQEKKRRDEERAAVRH